MLDAVKSLPTLRPCPFYVIGYFTFKSCVMLNDSRSYICIFQEFRPPFELCLFFFSFLFSSTPSFLSFLPYCSIYLCLSVFHLFVIIAFYLLFVSSSFIHIYILYICLLLVGPCDFGSVFFSLSSQRVYLRLLVFW